ncbi:RPA-related protein RADX isoform X2 [Toxotes jaculatrix]|uniref:RPA-related protein RADX isoform X2 n=1 Tax=Toxotes jaculatrix TaxID=941984 RepID=UPI001B3ACBE8|nr:RPA-related protein RADX isoform X2 [Toxotes jaculatrix]
MGNVRLWCVQVLRYTPDTPHEEMFILLSLKKKKQTSFSHNAPHCYCSGCLSNMAAPGCVFHRTLTRSRPGPNKASSSSPAVCREFLYVVELRRYTRDQGSSVYFPQAVLNGDDLYDVTLTDGDCRLQVTLDPGLNRLVERNVLQVGSTLRNATFTPGMAAQLPACTKASGEMDSYRLVRVEVRGGAPADGEADGARGFDVRWNSLPWFGSSEPAGSVVPLRANRSVFLPLWNNVDYSGEGWRETPPTEEEDEEDEEEEGRRPSVTVSELRDSFLSRHPGIVRGAVHHQLIVRIINKSHLMYYGKTERNCECPYKAVLEVCDPTGSVCVVLWNSVCVSWYHCLKPGDIISLRRYRVKQHYQAEPEDIEISVNSRNPAAQISVLPESSVLPEYLPPAPAYSFYSSKELLTRRHGAVCDVIGLLTFSGRSERIRSKDCRGAELLEYRWLRLEDGTSNQPIMVKLFSTSQPETHHRLHPLSVVVCSRLKLIRAADRRHSCCYLTNTTYTQVYCTGLGHHSEMSYRKLQPVRQFLQWLRSQDDGQVLSRALIGGFFMYPPPPVSLETFMKNRRGKPGFLRGAELERELERLCYRERRIFCIQATITMVTYSRCGEEDRCLVWTDRAASVSPSSSSPSSSSPRLSKSSPHPSPSPSSLLPLPSPPRLSSVSSFSPTSPSSGVSQLTPPPVTHRAGSLCKRKQQLQPDTPKKRRPWVTSEPEQHNNNNTVILFEASMEFLENKNADEDDNDDDDDTSSFVTAPLSPAFPPIAVETLPMRYDHARREEQAAAVAMGTGTTPGRFDSALRDYYTLRLRALSDAVMIDAVFLPHSSSSSSSPPLLPHNNTWTSILSHGAFSVHRPPPSPGECTHTHTHTKNDDEDEGRSLSPSFLSADLISMAAQLTNQRLVCVLEACHLGGPTTELILSRAFHLSN